MKIELVQNYLDPQCRIDEIDKELTLLDEKLKTPHRTTDDLIRHIELLKELTVLTGKSPLI